MFLLLLSCVRLGIFVFIAFVSETKSSSTHTHTHSVWRGSVGSMIMCPLGMQKMYDTQTASFGLSLSPHVSVVSNVGRTLRVCSLHSKSAAWPGCCGVHAKHQHVQVQRQQKIFYVELTCVSRIRRWSSFFMSKLKNDSTIHLETAFIEQFGIITLSIFKLLGKICINICTNKISCYWEVEQVTVWELVQEHGCKRRKSLIRVVHSAA